MRSWRVIAYVWDWYGWTRCSYSWILFHTAGRVGADLLYVHLPDAFSCYPAVHIEVNIYPAVHIEVNIYPAVQIKVNIYSAVHIKVNIYSAVQIKVNRYSAVQIM